MSHLIKALRTDFVPSESRLWYNKWVEKNVKGTVLDVGKSVYWDYEFPTIDTNKKLNPTYLQDICHSNLASNFYDTVLCNGMYEFVSNPQKMADEVIRILKTEGIAIFGFVGQDYKPYKRNWDFYMEGEIDFKAKVIDKKDFNKEYHYIICKKFD